MNMERNAGREDVSTTRTPGPRSAAATLSDRRHREGRVALNIEQQTARLPSDLFLWAALGAIGGSAILQIRRKRALSTFVGQWAPTFLLLGLYNKVVKVAGSDRMHSERALAAKSDSESDSAAATRAEAELH